MLSELPFSWKLTRKRFSPWPETYTIFDPKVWYVPPSNWHNIAIPSTRVLQNPDPNNYLARIFSRWWITEIHRRFLQVLGSPFFLSVREQVDLSKFHSLVSPPSIWHDERWKIIHEWLSSYYAWLVSWVLESTVFWRNTRSKLGHLRKALSSDIPDRIDELVRKMIENDKNPFNSPETASFFKKLIILGKYLQFGNDEPLSLGDEIQESLWLSQWCYVWNEWLSIRILPRNHEFITSGNLHGDCTALNRRFQIDDTKNIFWTIASWMLNPFYQIIQIESNGMPIMKAHFSLMQYNWELILCLDAVETSPMMREYLANNKDDTKFNHSKSHLFPMRCQIFDALIEFVLYYARSIWVSVVIAEEYSNTTWVRELLKKFPAVNFRLTDLAELFEWEILDYLILNSLGETKKKTEIQLLNTELEDKWLKHWMNSARVLMGNIKWVSDSLRWI